MTVSHHIETADMDQAEAMRARILASRVEEKRTDLVAERADAVARLNRVLDRPGNAPLGSVTMLPRPDAPPAALDTLVEASSADVAVKAAGVASAEKRLKATRLDLRPDLLVGAGIGFRGDFDPVVTARLGVELPLWQGKGQRPRIRAAEAEWEVAREEMRDACATARAEAARLRADWTRSDEQVVRYEQSFVPQTSLVFDAARSAYLGGRGDFSAVLEGLNLWLEARTGLARREADRYVAWAALAALLPRAPKTALEGEAP
jgi:outer membrane protein TolC